MTRLSTMDGGAVRDPRFGKVLVISVGIAVVTALLVIPYPFMGDQALFAVFGRMLGDGSTLYRDIWDVKQPGIFWFFAAAGGWTGFSEIGIHLVEAAWWIGWTVVLAVLLRRHLQRGWLAALMPLAGAGLFFISAGVSDLTQVESLLSLPIAVVALLLVDGPTTGRRRLLVAGVITGVVAVFKFLTVLIPLAMFLVVVLGHWRSHGPRRLVGEKVVPFVAGAMAPVAILLVWVLANDLGDTLVFTWFEYPPQVLGVQSRPASRLIGSALTFSVAFGSLGLAALFRVFDRESRGRQVTVLALVGILAGVVVIVMQLWWGYLFMVLIGPLAVIAIQGVDDLAGRGWRAAGLMVLGLTLVPAGFSAANKAMDLAGLLSGDSLTEYRQLSSRYSDALVIVDAADVDPGDSIYVMGDPQILYLTQANQSIPVNGWSPEFWTEEIWLWVADDLESSDTNALYIADWAWALAEERAPWFSDVVQETFVVSQRVGDGVWYSPR